MLREMNAVLDGIVDSHLPDDSDTEMALSFQASISKEVNSLCQTKIFRKMALKVHLRSFGSRASCLHGRQSDVDLSICGTYVELECLTKKPVYEMKGRKKGKILHVLASIMAKNAGKRYSVTPVMRARVPVLKVLHQNNGLKSDVCISKDIETYPKSELLLCLNLVDARFRMLLFLVKAWAKHNAIHDASLGRLNSYSLTSLVIFHLQTRPNPILPRLQDVLPPRQGSSDSVMEDSRQNMIQGMVRGIVSWRDTSVCNDESLLELFVSFLVLIHGLFCGLKERLTAQQNIEKIEPKLLIRLLRVSTYYGAFYLSEVPDDIFILNRRSRAQHTLLSKYGAIIIEDPFDKDDNSARGLSYKSFESIARVAKKSLNSCMYDPVDAWGMTLFGEEFILQKDVDTPKVINPWAAQSSQPDARRVVPNPPTDVQNNKVENSRNDMQKKRKEKKIASVSQEESKEPADSMLTSLVSLVSSLGLHDKDIEDIENTCQSSPETSSTMDIDTLQSKPETKKAGKKRRKKKKNKRAEVQAAGIGDANASNQKPKPTSASEIGNQQNTVSRKAKKEKQARKPSTTAEVVEEKPKPKKNSGSATSHTKISKKAKIKTQAAGIGDANASNQKPKSTSASEIGNQQSTVSRKAKKEKQARKSPLETPMRRVVGHGSRNSPYK